MVLISSKIVKNIYKNTPITIIGDFPSRLDETANLPLTHDYIINALANNGISAQDCSLLNLSEYHSKQESFESIEEIDNVKENIKLIKLHIIATKPKLVILLGEAPLKYFTGNYGIDKWRGSVLPTTDTLFVPTYSPQRVSKQRSIYPIFNFDIQKAFKTLKGYKVPINEFNLDPQGLNLEEKINDICNSPYISVDIESIRDSSHILCVGFAVSKTKATCIVNHDFNGIEYSFYNAVKRILESDSIKIFHNGSFDVEMLRINGIEVNNYTFDTLVAGHVLDPEMPQKLSFLTTLYTDRPYYKDMGKDSDEKTWAGKGIEKKDNFHIYNCLDCVCTYEIFQKQLLELEELKLVDYFKYKMEMNDVALEISNTGMLRDNERCLLIESDLKQKARNDQTLLNNILKKESNVKSPQQIKKVLYEDLALPVRKDYKGNITTDENAIVASMAYVKEHISSYKTEEKIMEWSLKLAALKLILRIRGYRQILSSYINATYSLDGRIRSSYRAAATETGRWACNSYVDGTGLNAQTMPREVLVIDE